MNRNLEYYKNLNYKIHLTVNKNIYYFSIPELFCFSQDKNIDVAYNNLLSLKEEFINNMDRSQNLDFINEPHSYRQYNFFKKLFPFFIKLLIISLISLAIIEISIISFGRVFYPKVEQINSTLDELKFILNNGPEIILLEKIPDILIKIENNINSIPDEKKEELVIRLKNILLGLEPFKNELNNFLDLSSKKPPQ